jgi:hypothetical protein
MKSDKLKPKAWIGYLVGYEGSKIYCIWDPKVSGIRAIKRTQDIVFDENVTTPVTDAR